jgi:hypothetical protein
LRRRFLAVAGLIALASMSAYSADNVTPEQYMNHLGVLIGHAKITCGVSDDDLKKLYELKDKAVSQEPSLVDEFQKGLDQATAEHQQAEQAHMLPYAKDRYCPGAMKMVERAKAGRYDH